MSQTVWMVHKFREADRQVREKMRLGRERRKQMMSQNYITKIAAVGRWHTDVLTGLTDESLRGQMDLTHKKLIGGGLSAAEAQVADDNMKRAVKEMQRRGAARVQQVQQEAAKVRNFVPPSQVDRLPPAAQAHLNGLKAQGHEHLGSVVTYERAPGQSGGGGAGAALLGAGVLGAAGLGVYGAYQLQKRRRQAAMDERRGR